MRFERILEVVIPIFLSVGLCAGSLLAETPDGKSGACPGLLELGATARAQYAGDGLRVEPTAAGARLVCVFQRLEADLTPGGLWLASTVTDDAADRFRVKVVAVGRGDGQQAALGHGGSVEVTDGLARLVRRGLIEEYTVSVDGVRQDFVLKEPPLGAQELCVGLAVDGARAKAAPEGVHLVLNRSGRRLVYGRLNVIDALGRELTARMAVPDGHRLTICVDDRDAQYPLRIDPTFSDANWMSMGDVPGVDGDVHAAVVDGTGNLYVGGSFSIAGNAVAANVAKWNGSGWSALSSGMDGTVSALAVDASGTLYAGGSFASAGGAAASRVAKWDGTGWSALSSGMNGTVSALAVDASGNVYAGGSFTSAGGAAAYYVAKWNGSVWSGLGYGTGLMPQVNALTLDGLGNLYVGAWLSGVSGANMSSVAKWDGNEWWLLALPMGAASSSHELALATDNSGNLYLGGSFTNVEGVAANGVAKWDGSCWSALGSGMNDAVAALAVDGAGSVYAGGSFTAAGGVRANRMAKWDGSNWSALGAGMGGEYDSISALAVDGAAGILYAGGYFTDAGAVVADHVAQWDGSTWSALGSGSASSCHELTADASGNLYAAGRFIGTNGEAVGAVAKWNGSAWSALGSGMNSTVTALAVDGSGNLYAGGSFTNALGTTNSVAKWDGSGWSVIDSQLGRPSYPSARILALTVDDAGNLYAGGSFVSVNGVAALGLAKWDGSGWSALGTGVDDNSSIQVTALALDDSGDLYAACNFLIRSTQNGRWDATNNVYRWNGTAWSALGSGMGGDHPHTYALAADSYGNIYAGGDFCEAGGTTAIRVAKWDGSAWSALGSGMNSTVRALSVDGSGNLYAGGYFTTAGGVAANRVAKWDGSTWSALGSGMNNSVQALATTPSGNLYAAGEFTTAGGKVSPYVAYAMFGGQGTLSIDVRPDEGSWTITGPDDYAGPTNGTGDLPQTPAATGSYAVVYGNLDGYTAPQSETRYVGDGSNVVFVGTYARKEGTLSIDVTPSNGWWTITGPDDYAGPATGTGDVVQITVPTGQYTVEYGELTGYTKPASQTKTVWESQTTSFSGTYIRDYGSISIDVNPEPGIWRISEKPVDYVGPTTGTGDLVRTAAPTGEYTVEYGELTGYTKPASQTKTVLKGENASFSGTYARDYGSISIDVTPTSGSWTISGPADYAGPKAGTGDLVQTTAPTGQYTVEYGELTGYTKPASQTKTVLKGENASFSGTYVRDYGSISIDVDPEAGSWRISEKPDDYAGSTNGTGDLARARVPTGQYTVEYGPLPNHTTPASETKAVVKGEDTVFTGEYHYVTSFVVTEPTTNTVVRGGDSIEVAWVGNSPLGAVNIELGKGDGLIAMLATSVPAATSNVTVTVDLPGGLVSGVGYWVRVTDTDNALDRVDSEEFTVSRVAANDFDGDGKSDLGCYFAPGGNWYLMMSRDGFKSWQFGYAGTIHVSGDFDGDGRCDFGCYFPPDGNWYLMLSTEGFKTWQFGYAGTLPVMGDLDGDGRCDFGVYHPPSGSWYFMLSTEGFKTRQFGYAGTLPVMGDLDGDGRCDFGVYHPPSGSWYFMLSTEGFKTWQFGYDGTLPLTGDYDGDGRCDFGCYHAYTGMWYLMKSSEGFQTYHFGYAGTVPLGAPVAGP